jgi:rare lipoprotein A
MGAGKTALTAEKKIITRQDTSETGQEMVYSLLHGVNNAATIGISIRNAEVPHATFQSTSFSLIYDIGTRRYYNGVSSFYGKKFHGRKTASGETFNMNGLSAAHKTLPLGTMLKVTNLETGKSVVVKVNDRGPYEKGRSLDLSQGAAKRIGLDKKGTGEVEIETLGLMNFSLLGGARQSQSTEKEKSLSSTSLYYGLTADFRLDSAIKLMHTVHRTHPRSLSNTRQALCSISPVP